MAKIIDQLRAEHADMARMLEVLEAELDAIDEGRPPYHALIEDIAAYFLDYPDACHHPKENVLYSRVVANRPNSMGPVVDLEAEHRAVAQLVRDFAKAAAKLRAGDNMPPAAFAAIARTFIERQRSHIGDEERDLFPLALDTLDVTDWAVLDARVDSKTDPVFGAIPDERFKKLRDVIMS